MKYKNKFGTIPVMEEEDLFRGKTLALSMSGGADSTMLCYLLAKTSYEQNLEITIQPYNGYDTWAPIDSSGVPNIIEFIRKEFPDIDIQWPLAVVFNTNGNHAPNDKNMYIRPLIHKLVEHKMVDVVMSGISMGQPLDVQTQLLKEGRIERITRLPGYHLWNEVENSCDHQAPFKHIDKRFIIQCYKDFNLEHLLKMTNSCTHPRGNCGKCWWCQERVWAFKEVFSI